MLFDSSVWTVGVCRSRPFDKSAVTHSILSAIIYFTRGLLWLAFCPLLSSPSNAASWYFYIVCKIGQAFIWCIICRENRMETQCFCWKTKQKWAFLGQPSLSCEGCWVIWYQTKAQPLTFTMMSVLFLCNLWRPLGNALKTTCQNQLRSSIFTLSFLKAFVGLNL